MQTNITFGIIKVQKREAPVYDPYVWVKNKSARENFSLLTYFFAQKPNTSTSINYYSSFTAVNFETGGVTPIFHSIRSRTRYTTSRTPKFKAYCRITCHG